MTYIKYWGKCWFLFLFFVFMKNFTHVQCSWSCIACHIWCVFIGSIYNESKTLQNSWKLSGGQYCTVFVWMFTHAHCTLSVRTFLAIYFVICSTAFSYQVYSGSRKPCTCPDLDATCCPDGYARGDNKCECPSYPGSFCCPPRRYSAEKKIQKMQQIIRKFRKNITSNMKIIKAKLL